jgi:hypothetical protein
MSGKEKSADPGLMSAFGTFRTMRDVRVESGMQTKADASQRLRIYGFAP